MAAKGQGISINVIVIAAIALLILVILSVLVIRSGGILNKGTQCESTGGKCVLQDDGCSSLGSDWQQDRTKGCEDLNTMHQICCRTP